MIEIKHVPEFKDLPCGTSQRNMKDDIKNLEKKNYNSKKEDNKEKDQREDERNVIL